MQQLHKIQLNILKSLSFKKDARFVELGKGGVPNNQLSFHISKLLQIGFIKKTDGVYTLTDKGKEYANRIGDDNKVMFQGKISILVVPFRNEYTELLLHTRLKHPWFGCQGYMTGKVYHGESIYDSAKREFYEESNLKGNLELFEISHEIVKSDDQVYEDKYFYQFRVLDPVGELAVINDGDFEWIKVKDLEKRLTKTYTGRTVDDYIKFINKAIEYDSSGKVSFEEVYRSPINF